MEGSAVPGADAPVMTMAEEVRERYDAERYRGLSRSPEGRKHLDAVACHDVGVDLGLGTEEVAEYVAEAGGEKPDLRYL